MDKFPAFCGTPESEGDLRASLRWMCLVDASYIFLGFGSGGADGSSGAALMFLYTGTARLLAWLTLDRLAETAGSADRKALRGIGRARPVTATLFAFAMFAALGVSPFLTPDAKPLVMHAAIASSLWIVPALMVAANALLAWRTIHMVHGIWLESGRHKEEYEDLSPHAYPYLALAGLLALMGIFGHSLMSFAAFVFGESAELLPDLAVTWHAAALIPFAGAFVVWLVGRVNRQYANILACALMGLALAAAFLLDSQTPLGKLFAVVVTAIGFLVTLYSCGYIHKPANAFSGAENNYYFFLLLLFGSLAGIATSDNLGGLFVFWELMTVTSYVLVAYENTKEAHAAAIKYYVMCTVAAAFLLPALLMLSVLTGSLSVATVAAHAGALGPGIAALIALLALIGYGVKAGLVPGHSWLPDAHPAAPSSISAPLSGVLTKAGIFGLVQLLFGLLGMGVLLGEQSAPGIPGIGSLITFLGVLTMLYGELMALRQRDIKRMLAYSTMGQVGEITITLGLCTWLAATGALFHLINHAIMKDLLFLCSGIVILRAGGRTLDDLKGLGRAMPVTAGCMIIGLLSIMGLPPFAGFISKFTMLYAIARESIFLASLLLLASLAGCIYYTRIIRALIFEPYTGPPVQEPPLTMRAPIIILAALCVIIGLFPGIALALVMPVVDSFVQAGKIAPQTLPSLSIIWPPYALWLMLGAAVPVYFRNNPERAGQATGWVLAAAAFLVVLFGQELDGISFWFALLVPAIGALNMFYASGYMRHSHTQWRFYAFFLFMTAGLTGVAASQDLFNFFLFWEIMSSWSLYFVIVHEENPDALREGFKYFFFNVLGAAFLFLGVVLLINWCGGASFTRISQTLPMLDPWQIGFVLLVMAAGFVMKAAQLPFRIDIQMHPATAPTPVSGYISSVLLKSALFGLTKLFLMLGGGVAAASWFGKAGIMDLTLWVGGITIVMAGIYAVFQRDIKLVLIYSTVSQLGYIVVAVALGSSLGIAGGLLHLVNHMLFKDLLFLMAGAVIAQTHLQNMDHMGGLAARMPLTLLCFTVGALCVIGVPPSNGFTSKWIIYHALMEQGQVFIAILSLAGSVITLAYFAKMLHSVFLGQPMPGLEKVCEAPRSMLMPMFLLTGGCVVTSVFPGLVLIPINTILVELGLPAQDVAPWGLATGAGAWNATVAALLFAVALFGGWWLLRGLSGKQRVTPIHTCGVDPADLNPHTSTRDIYSAPADALAEILHRLRGLRKGSAADLLRGRCPLRLPWQGK
ncbi:MAG: oxidoreductase [Desulfovibrionaceae bacterium]|nr:oxidoreductase [Desulfovibrionaceae bacterium]